MTVIGMFDPLSEFCSLLVLFMEKFWIGSDSNSFILIDFKTPTSISRTKPSSVPVLGPDSPHNDLDLQQDIVWDAASPSPRRSGKVLAEPPGSPRPAPVP